MTIMLNLVGCGELAQEFVELTRVPSRGEMIPPRAVYSKSNLSFC